MDERDALTGDFVYQPYGATTSMGSKYPFEYTGRVPVGPGLYHYRARYYDPVSGRFISEDPIGFEGGDLNLYLYVANNPTGRVDPTGLDSYIVSQFGHEAIAIDDPERHGSTIVFDFFPKAAGGGLGGAVPGVVREQQFGAGKGPFGSFEVPGTRRKQNAVQDEMTIKWARQLQRAAESGDLKYRVYLSDLNCLGFARAVQQGP